MADDQSAALRQVIEPIVRERGFDLEGVSLVGTGPHRVLRVVVDSDHGVSLDAAAGISRALSEALDSGNDDILGSAPYRLEVTSRGAGAPLTAPRHFRRAIGRLVRLTLADGSDTVVRLAAASPEELLVFDGPSGTVARPQLIADVTKAAVELEFKSVPDAVQAALARYRQAQDQEKGDTAR